MFRVAFLDRFRALAGSNKRKALTSTKGALALIEQGNALEADGLPEQALQLYKNAILLAPNLARAYLNCGNTLFDTGDTQGALAAYAEALVHDSECAAAHFNMGNVYLRSGQREAALVAYSKAIEVKPDFVDAEVALGGVMDDLLKFADAVDCYRRALEIRPGYAEVHSNLGNTLRKLGFFELALASYRQALTLKPDYADGHINLGNALKDLGRLDEAKESYRLALQFNPDSVEAYSNLLFAQNYRAEKTASALMSEARCYGALAARQARRYTAWVNTRDPDRCLHVGLVSGDLRAHPVSYFLESVLGALADGASGSMKLYAYSSHFVTDEITERIQARCHRWRSVVGLSDETLSHLIRDDGIDILIDLSGHTAHNRLPLFAWKPAPVQVSWLGYFATTGVAAIDYLIADQWTLPESEEVNFTERIWRLPDTRLCFTPPDVNLEASRLPALHNGYLTFACFNNLTKINNAVVVLWARILAAVPNSRLFLKSPQLKESSTRQSVVELFAAHDIDAERLILEGLSCRSDYLATYQRVDMALDPFPYTGGTTTAESLWMGVPVVTLEGRRFVSRQGVGLLMNAGLPDWIATDSEDYVARAVSHASNLQSLAELRQGLRQQVLASPVFDALRFARHFEAGMRGMWRHWCEQQQDQTI